MIVVGVVRVVTGRFSEARDLVTDSMIVLQSRFCWQFLQSKSVREYTLLPYPAFTLLHLLALLDFMQIDIMECEACINSCTNGLSYWWKNAEL